MKLQMNEQLLKVLCALRNKRHLAISESQLGLIEDWTDSLREYFNSMPKALVEEVGLKQNEFCYRAIESLRIPQEWLETEVDQLGQFEFGY
jgi:hypothetical protein